MSSPVQQARSRLANAVRWGTSDEALDARRDLAAAKLEKYVRDVTATAPALTAAQRQHLAALILAGATR